MKYPYLDFVWSILRLKTQTFIEFIAVNCYLRNCDIPTYNNLSRFKSR